MKLPNTDISIMTVRNCLGCPSTDLGTLVAAAKTGGTGGYAFQIKENGFTSTQLGYLIDGALPYWNIWSKNSPGHFFYYTDGSLKYRLKHDPSDGAGVFYRYALGDFRGYNSDASAPSVLCTNAVNNVIQYYQSTGKIQIVYTAMCGELDWASLLYVNHFYLRVVGISGSSESELAFRESPYYVNVDGTSTSYNDRFELSDLSIYSSIRLELWLGHNTGTEVTNKSKIPFIPTQTIQLKKMSEGVNTGNIIWFYIYNTSVEIESIAIPGYGSKIPVTNKKMEFIYNSGTPNVGYYQFSFDAKIDGDYYMNVPPYGSRDIHGTYEVLGQGLVYKQDGSRIILDYVSLGTIYLEGSKEHYQINIPTTYANNRYDTGIVHLFIRLKDRP